MINLIAALTLAFLHQWAAYVHPGKYIDRRYWLAFADGISITYIFIGLLPEILHQAEASSAPPGSSFAQLLITSIEQYPFLPLLAGFTVFFGLEKGIGRKNGFTDQRAEGSVHFWVHMVGVSLYKIILGYLLANMTNVAAIASFAVAMLMHFLVIDFHLVEMHHAAYQRIGRWLLTLSFMAGWILGLLLSISPGILAVMISFVAGGAVLMIIQDEFSEAHGNSYAAFVTAVVVYTALLIVL
ncbi:hypothetical protein F6455_07225 [Proteobacteria bacterium 005FR1]|nr:hypothetical protein [Proteobacteria bacterium 005FR1]